MLMETHVLLDKRDFQQARGMYARIVQMLTEIVDVDQDGVLTYEELKQSGES